MFVFFFSSVNRTLPPEPINVHLFKTSFIILFVVLLFWLSVSHSKVFVFFEDFCFGLKSLFCFFIIYYSLMFDFLWFFLTYRGVQCHDSESGAQCGPCPLGYEGDGRSCTKRNPCLNGPCPSGW